MRHKSVFNKISQEESLFKKQAFLTRKISGFKSQLQVFKTTLKYDSDLTKRKKAKQNIIRIKKLIKDSKKELSSLDLSKNKKKGSSLLKKQVKKKKVLESKEGSKKKVLKKLCKKNKALKQLIFNNLVLKNKKR